MKKGLAVLVILIIFCSAAVADTRVPADDDPGSRIPMKDSQANVAAPGEEVHRTLSGADRQIVRNFIDEFNTKLPLNIDNPAAPFPPWRR